MLRFYFITAKQGTWVHYFDLGPSNPTALDDPFFRNESQEIGPDPVLGRAIRTF